MVPKLKAWVVFPGGTKFGEGRADLFRLVDEQGSLKAAVEALGMSYRAAWGYVRELEDAAGFRFLEPVGNARSGGARLTQPAKRFLKAFARYRDGVDRLGGKQFQRAFKRPSAR